MQVVNKSEKVLSLQQDDNVTLTPRNGQQASSQVLPVNFDGLANVKGDEDEDEDNESEGIKSMLQCENSELDKKLLSKILNWATNCIPLAWAWWWLHHQALITV
ncbi:hypothetical protein Tco_1358714 [Tanacetum coccineum]